MKSLGSIRMGRAVFLGGILVILLSSGQAISAPIPRVGDVAPDFLLDQLEGNPIALSALRGKVVFVNFFGFM